MLVKASTMISLYMINIIYIHFRDFLSTERYIFVEVFKVRFDSPEIIVLPSDNDYTLKPWFDSLEIIMLWTYTLHFLLKELLMVLSFSLWTLIACLTIVCVTLRLNEVCLARLISSLDWLYALGDKYFLFLLKEYQEIIRICFNIKHG